MTPERWQAVKAIFNRACMLAPAEQANFLAEACGNDEALRIEVESLLAANGCADAIVDQPAEHYLPPGALEEPEDHWLGKRVGAYKLVARLGHGGMGDVYRGRRADAQIEKEVAIKLVRAGLGTDSIVRRFRAERQILADLEHPNVARLLDAGTTDSGEPYLVMELVDGEPIDEYCESRNLDIPERLRLFRQVCAAVSYAHQHLVVHRDLKPTNILVTAQGAVKLLDFGIARLLQAAAETGDQPDATRTMLRAMTPAFSSPEQILGLRITTASDVYSLGVVLYHLLTGRSPYRSALASTQDAIKDVCETEPTRPSAVAAQRSPQRSPRGVPDRELDDITLRALRKEPEKRYGSVEQLSEDLRRYLAGLPVIARGDQFTYLATKFLRRHRMGIAAAGLVAVSLITGLVFAIREARLASEQRAVAARHFDSVRKLASTYMFQVHDAIKDLPGSTAARSQLVTTAIQYLDALAQEAGTDRGLQRELAESYDRVGDIQGQPNASNTGHATAALASYSKAISLFDSVLALEPANMTIRSELAMTHLKRSRVFMMFTGDPVAGAKESAQAIALAAEVSAARPDDVAARSALATAYRVYTHSAEYTGHYTEALAGMDKAISIVERLQLQYPKDAGIEQLLATVYSDRATILPPDNLARVIEQDMPLIMKALAIDQRLLRMDTNPPLSRWRAIFADRNNIGLLLFIKHDYSGALALFRDAEAAVSKTMLDAQNAQARLDVARARMNVGRTLVEIGRLDEAHDILAKNIALLEGVAHDNDSQEIQYLLAVYEEELGTIESRRAQAAGNAAAQLRHWRLAEPWFARSSPRFQRIIKNAVLNAFDRPPVDRASAGLDRSRLEIDRLTHSLSAGTDVHRPR